MAEFVIAGFLLLIMPGPGVLSAAAVGASFAVRDGGRYIVGLWAGNFSVSLIVISGLWAVLESIPYLRLILSIASLLYFTYLAIRVARANPRIGFGAISTAPGFCDGLILQLLNPKAYAANVFLFANFAVFPDNWAREVVLKIIVSNAIWVVMHGAWWQLGVVVKRMNLPPTIQRRINITMAGLLMLVVVLALTGLR